MFESARLRLTAWYLLIIMLISILFSVAFYRASTQEIQRVIDKIEASQLQESLLPFDRSLPGPQFALEGLEAIKQRLKIMLFILNGGIFLVAGGVGYFLAGRTLRPIKVMIDEQNQFISSASHELRTPIATMRAEMEGSLLEKNITDKRARTLIKSNLEELGSLQDLSNHLLRLAQVHASQSHKYQGEVALQDAIKSAQKKLFLLAKKKHISFTIDIQKAIIIGDKRSITEVFMILFDNAIKYSPKDTTITITSQKSPKNISVFVTDQGVGIAKVDRYYIFDRFYRADKARNKDGYGLGLSIAKRIVELHNGSITVKSKENKGTTFVVTFPRKSS